MIIKKCLWCNKEFKTIPYKIKRGEGKFCSRKCVYKSLKGKPHSFEAIKKISLANKGKIRSIEAREKYSRAKKGSFNPNWIGGKIITQYGYIYIYKPNNPSSNIQGYIFEHRLIMEKHLGRKLKKRRSYSSYKWKSKR